MTTHAVPHSVKRPLAQIIEDAAVANGRGKKRRIRKVPRVRETVFRILCHISKTGSIIGKGGSIIKSIRNDTRTMIRVEQPVSGCDETVVTICFREDASKTGKPNDRAMGEMAQVEEEVDYLPESDEEGRDINNQQSNVNHGGNEGLLSDKDQIQAHGKQKDFLGLGDDKQDGLSQLKEAAGKKVQGDGEGDSKDGVEKGKGERGDGGKNNACSKETRSVKSKKVAENEKSSLSPIQEALLRVHLRITEEEPTKDGEAGDKDKEAAVCTRLLVPTSQVGCLLGKKGKIIQQMRDESGAEIRVLPKDEVPRCAAPADEVLQITGDLIAVRKALLAASSQLENNPPKDSRKEFVSSLGHGSDSLDTVLKSSGYHGPPGPFVPGSNMHSTHEVVFRILCSKEKIGGLIGRGGNAIQSLREETGAKISIDVSSSEGDERVVRISAYENLDDPYSNAQKALMIIHNKIMGSDPNYVTTKLLVPANQAGCLIGKGGSIMIEMKKSTRANIHIYGKEHLPPCALPNDELVHISGNASVLQKALLQITSRLRENLSVEKSRFTSVADNPGFVQAWGSSHNESSPLGGTMSRMTPSGNYCSPFSDMLTGSKGPSFRPADPLTPPPSFRPRTSISSFGTSTRDYSNFGSNTRDYTNFGSSTRDFDSFGSSTRDFDSFGSSTKNVPNFGSSARDLPSFSSGVRDYPSFGSGSRDFPSFGYDSYVDRDFTRIHAKSVVTSKTVQVTVPERALSSVLGENGGNLAQIREISGAKVKVNLLPSGTSETTVEISGTPEQTHAAQSLLQAFIFSGQ